MPTASTASMLRAKASSSGTLAEKLRGVKFTPAKDFVYRTPDGVDIDGWYYLPPNFDPSKKYPMIVYYYGGTTPLSRELETTYDLAMVRRSRAMVAYSLNPRPVPSGYGHEASLLTT